MIMMEALFFVLHNHFNTFGCRHTGEYSFQCEWCGSQSHRSTAEFGSLGSRLGLLLGSHHHQFPGVRDDAILQAAKGSDSATTHGRGEVGEKY
jgi:hypothetical protein